MDEYADIYYVDENRNAVITTDHRTGSTNTSSSGPQRQPQVMYGPAAPPWVPQNQSAAATLFGKLTTGMVVEMVAQIFAALQSLPAAPVVTRDASTDAANMILFQTALAQHAKRDE